MKTELLRKLLQGRTVVITDISKFRPWIPIVEPNVTIVRVNDQGSMVTDKETITGHKGKYIIDRKTRSVCFLDDIGDDIISRTYTIQGTSDRDAWREAEEERDVCTMHEARKLMESKLC